MKKIFLLFSILILNQLVFAQRTLPETEIIFHTRGASSNTITTFEISPVMYLDEFPTAIYSRTKANPCSLSLMTLPLQSIDLVGNVSCNYSGLEYIFPDENWLGSTSCNGTAAYRPFANSLYEIKLR